MRDEISICNMPSPLFTGLLWMMQNFVKRDESLPECLHLESEFIQHHRWECTFFTKQHHENVFGTNMPVI